MHIVTPNERMDALSDDPDTIKDFKGIAQVVHLQPQTVAGIFFGVFIFVCMSISLACWYLHHRYDQAQKRATLFPGMLEKGSKTLSPPPKPQMAQWRKVIRTSSVQTLLPNRPERAMFSSSRSAPEDLGRTNSAITLVESTSSIDLAVPKEVVARGSRTYSLTLLDWYATMDEELPPNRSLTSTRFHSI
ncbi:hypothetical protein FRB90_001167 [Tulasnella sp. 427]|nr:hypothetical protein FRB90_001167 [Tulasnella sp. 427]